MKTGVAYLAVAGTVIIWSACLEKSSRPFVANGNPVVSRFNTARDLLDEGATS